MSTPGPETDSSDFSPAKNQLGSCATKTLHGIWRIVPSPMLSEILAQSGLDFQILDCEHGAYDYATLLPDILACERHGCAPIVRVSGTDKIEVQRCLDLGARGLVFPQLDNADEFARAGAMMDYAPAGTRGFNPFVRAGNYGIPPSAPASRPAGDPGRVEPEKPLREAAGLEPAVARPWFIPIVETLRAAGQIEAIAAIERIDLIYIGAYDLSAQLGCPGKMDAPELTRLIDRMVDVCAQAKKPVALMALSGDAAKQFAARGVQAIVHGVESHRIKQAMRDIVQPLRDVRLSNKTSNP